MKILEICGNEATCGVAGMRVRARLDLIEEPKVGEWVLVHAGFAITKVDAEEAEETWALLEEAYRSAAE